MYQDKMAIMQILGSVLNNPLLLAESNKYQLTNDDFPEKFHKIIFSAIYNLYNDGTEVINEITIDGFLRDYDIQYKIFNDNDGLEYLYKIRELAEEGNFEYYFKRVKKFSLIREMSGLGFDVKEIYDDSEIDPKEKETMQEKFDKLSIEDILKVYETRMIDIKDKFKSTSHNKGSQAGEGATDLLERFKVSPDIGAPMNSKLLTSIVRGARKKKFYIRSSVSGGGKTRLMIADACNLSALEIFNTKTKKWEENGFNEHSVVITTEMLIEELQTIAIAYISGVEEHKILFNTVTEEESQRTLEAAAILEKSPIWFEELPDFNVDDIERTIEKNVILNRVEYVFFDYIHTSVSIFSSMTKASGMKLREDQILLLMSDRLKYICNKHEVFLMSATQLNGDWKEAWTKGSQIDMNMVRGGKSIVDKADFFCIVLPISKIEKKDIEPILKEKFIKEPNYVTHISKNRGNRHDKVKIFSHLNMGSVRMEDAFVTNFDNELINVPILNIKTNNTPKAQLEF